MSGRSWKFESSHGHEKQKSANSRFFLLYHYPFRVLFSTYYTKLTLVVVKKNHDNTNNKDNISFLFQKCCPRLSLVVVKISHDNTNNKDNISILFPKVIVQGCPSLSSKKHDNTNNKDNISILFQKCCPRLSLVVVKKTRQNKQQRQHFFLIPKMLSKVVLRCRQKNHLFMKIFIFVSENIKMFCLGNISLSLKSTIRFFQKESHLFNELRNEMVD